MQDILRYRVRHRRYKQPLRISAQGHTKRQLFCSLIPGRAKRRRETEKPVIWGLGWNLRPKHQGTANLQIYYLRHLLLHKQAGNFQNYKPAINSLIFYYLLFYDTVDQQLRFLVRSYKPFVKTMFAAISKEKCCSATKSSAHL